MKTLSSFVVGDKVLAKIRGYRPWPAVVKSVSGESRRKLRYGVLFYGTYQTGVCKHEDLSYFVSSMSLQSTSKSFQKAVREICEVVKTEPKVVLPKLNKLALPLNIGDRQLVKSENGETLPKSELTENGETVHKSEWTVAKEILSRSTISGFVNKPSKVVCKKRENVPQKLERKSPTVDSRELDENELHMVEVAGQKKSNLEDVLLGERPIKQEHETRQKLSKEMAPAGSNPTNTVAEVRTVKVVSEKKSNLKNALLSDKKISKGSIKKKCKTLRKLNEEVAPTKLLNRTTKKNKTPQTLQKVVVAPTKYKTSCRLSKEIALAKLKQPIQKVHKTPRKLSNEIDLPNFNPTNASAELHVVEHASQKKPNLKNTLSKREMEKISKESLEKEFNTRQESRNEIAPTELNSMKAELHVVEDASQKKYNLRTLLGKRERENTSEGSNKEELGIRPKLSKEIAPTILNPTNALMICDNNNQFNNAEQKAQLQLKPTLVGPEKSNTTERATDQEWRSTMNRLFDICPSENKQITPKEYTAFNSLFHAPENRRKNETMTNVPDEDSWDPLKVLSHLKEPEHRIRPKHNRNQRKWKPTNTEEAEQQQNERRRSIRKCVTAKASELSQPWYYDAKVIDTEIELMKAESQIKESLHFKNPNFEECLAAIRHIMAMKLERVSLLKYPQVLKTIEKVTKYTANSLAWDQMDEETQFYTKRRVDFICAKARQVETKFRTILQVPRQEQLRPYYEKLRRCFKMRYPNNSVRFSVCKERPDSPIMPS